MSIFHLTQEMDKIGGTAAERFPSVIVSVFFVPLIFRGARSELISTLLLIFGHHFGMSLLLQHRKHSPFHFFSILMQNGDHVLDM